MKLKIRNTIFIGFLILTACDAYACHCRPHDLLTDISNSDAIFIGTVTQTNNYRTYIFQVKKVYKGNILLQGNYIIKQGTTSCNMTSFLINHTYLIFSTDGTVHNCSRSSRYENNRDIPLMDSIFKDNIRSDGQTNLDLIKLTEQYNNFLSLESGVLSIKNKKCLFWNGKKILKRENIIESDNFFYPTRYYLAADAENCKWLKEMGVDYLIKVTQSHQLQLINPGYLNQQKPKRKMVKQIKNISNT